MSTQLAPTYAPAADARAGLSVLVRAADGDWQAIGTEIAAGILPEQFSCTANESGPDTCSFILKRTAALPWPDLIAFNRCEVLIDGSPVWGGRIWEAPLSSGGDDSIAVQGRGWQYHLDDDLIDTYYVHSRLSEWRDTRTFPDVTLGTNDYSVAGQFNSPGGVIQFGWFNGTTIGGGARVGVMLDLGANRTAKRLSIEYETSNNAGTILLYARDHDTSDLKSDEGLGDFSTAINGTSLSTLGASGTTSATFSTVRRYVSIFLYHNSVSGVTAGDDHWISLKAVRIYAATAYESGNQSILKADTVITDARDLGCPLLSDSDELIDAGTFSIPDLSPDGYQTPRQLMEAANAYEGNLLGVNAQGQVFFRERDTVPSIEIGPWAGSSFQDASTNAAEELFNRVIVQGTAPDGTPVREVRTADSPLLERQGFDRSTVLAVSSAITATAAQTLGDIWLGEMSTPKFRGSVTVQGHGGARLVSGGAVHASQLLLRCGQKLRVGMVDPETGAWTRDALIKSVSYDHTSETATVQLDNDRGNFATLLARYGGELTRAGIG